MRIVTADCARATATATATAAGSLAAHDGILVPRDLLESACDADADANADSDADPSAIISSSSASVTANNSAADEPQPAVDAQADGTRAVQSVSEELDGGERVLPSSYLPAADFPPLPPLRSWSCAELRAFLHAWERLTRACALLRQAGSSRLELHGSGEWLPVLLPWPREYGPGDTRPPPAHFPRRCHRTLMWWEMFLWEGKWNDAVSSAGSTSDERHGQGHESESEDGALPAYDPEEDLESGGSASVRHLSSVVRGCPWPLDLVNDDGNDGLARREQECGVVARRVALALRLSRQLYDGGVNTAWWHQPGARSATTRTWSWEIQSPGVEEMFVLTESDASSAPGPAQAAAASAATSYLQCLLTSSLVVSMGSEHSYPWPVLLVAPLAPGWIGGFMSRATSMG